MKKPLSFYQPTMQIPDTTSGFDISNSLLIENEVFPGFRKPGDAFGDKPLMQNLYDTQKFSQSVEPLKAQKAEEDIRRNQFRGNMLMALGDALRGKDISSGFLQRQQSFQQQADERKAEAERNRILASLPDDTRRVFEAYGGQAAFEYQQDKENERKQEYFKSIPQNVSRDDYETPKEYYRALGQEYTNAGFIEQGLKLFELGKPLTTKDYTKEILSQRDKVEKQYTPVKDNLLNFQKLDTALNSNSGTGAYTALVFYLKNLDGSVVKSEEVNTFQEMQGFLKSIEQSLEKTKGKGMTSDVKSQLRNISSQATALTLQGYNDYLQGSRSTYDALGLNPDLIYSGYLIDPSGINLEQVLPSYFEEKIEGSLED